MSTEDFLIHIEEGALYVEIPKEIYEELNILEGDELSIGIEQDKMTLAKVRKPKNSS